MSASQRRLLRDLKKIKSINSSEKQFDASPNSENLFLWNARIFGPSETIWDGAVFKLNIEYPQDYPHHPPSVKFIDIIPFHPNVYSNGQICLSILDKKNEKLGWSSAYDTYSVLTAIQSLLDNPNPNSPANNQAAELYQFNRSEYNLRVKQVVESTWG